MSDLLHRDGKRGYDHRGPSPIHLEVGACVQRYLFCVGFDVSGDPGWGAGGSSIFAGGGAVPARWSNFVRVAAGSGCDFTFAAGILYG